jgi:hypothetical protein
MKLAAIYNVWDGEEHLEKSVNSIKAHVDFIICVCQTKSNRGELYNGGLEEVKRLGLSYVIYKPEYLVSPTRNEAKKRNIGVELAEKMGATHYILLDCDEVYPDFERGKQLAEGHDATVCQMVTYFGNENLIYDRPESYFVPFICKIGKVGNFDNGYYCDPTRKPNIKAVEIPIFMHHYSYVRNDIERKLRNSSAYINLRTKISSIILDYKNARAGMYVEMVDRTLKHKDE